MIICVRPTRRFFRIAFTFSVAIYVTSWFILSSYYFSLVRYQLTHNSSQNAQQRKIRILGTAVSKIFISTTPADDVEELNAPDPDPTSPSEKIVQNLETKEETDINSCHVPKLDKGGKEILKMEQEQFDQRGAPSCVSPEAKSRLLFKMDFESRLTFLRENDNEKNFTCQYQTMSRVDNTAQDWQRKLGETFYPIDTASKVTKIRPEHQYLRIECGNSSDVLYEDYFPNLALQPKVEARAKARENPAVPKLSIMIVGLDSCSNMNFHRWLPKSLRFLKETLKATEFLGLNTFGGGTLWSLYPIISGIHFEDFRRLYPHYETSVLDDAPFIWKHLVKMGYRTSLQEDGANFAFKGFRHQPVDYDLRLLSKLLLGTPKGHSLSSYSSNECFGAHLTLEYMLQNLLNFAHALKDRPFFQMTWIDSLTHNVNKMATYADEPLLQFLTQMHSNDLLNNTALLILSDHGMRFGMMREKTEQGYLEERLPLLYLTLPPWFREKYPAAIFNLESNARHLSSFMDIYKTLLDFTNLDHIEDSAINERALDSKQVNDSTGVSFFLPIKPSRTCESARISPMFCICMNKTAVSMTDPRLPPATAFILSWMNKKLENFSQCSTLSLSAVLEAQLLTTNRSMFIEYWRFGDHNRNVENATPLEPQLKIKFRTKPGDAVWEATTQYHNKTENWVMGEISRINAYGTVKNCVPLRSLREFCICEDS